MKGCCSLKNLSCKDFFLTTLGITFGLWLFWVGLSKWIFFGPSGFLGYIQSDMSKSGIPSALITIAGWVILIAEPVLGLMLVASRGRCRLCWTLTAGLLFLLTLGKTSSGDFATVANIWQYLVLALVAAAFAGSNNDSCCSTSSCCDDEEDSCCSSDSDKGGCCSTEKSDHHHTIGGCCGGSDKSDKGGCCQG